MNDRLEPMGALNERATNALIREVGVVGTIRFLNQFRSGEGDYTRERQVHFKGKIAADIIQEIKEQRPGGKND